MTDQAVIDALSDLRSKELTSLLPRLAESTIFVSPELAADHPDLQLMIDEEDGHLQLLDETILQLGGNLRPARADITTADLHYVALDVLLPRCIKDQQGLIAACETAAKRVAECAPAAAAVNTLLAEHREHARLLERLLGRFQ